MMLHVGCGPIKLPGYINIDIESSHKPDMCGDILEMDFSDVDVIYSCHMAEHLDYPGDMVKFLRLCYKWLKYDGILRLAVPSLELAAKAYVNGSDLKFLYGDYFKGYYYEDTACERLNFFMKSWDHKMCYDYRLLWKLLDNEKFRWIDKKEANRSNIPNFTHDRFISESLYVEAIK